ncbi:unnamed protein product [Mytilus coruscus]|uniref:Tesmin/TSO1-like CXC domain-containing protein n=1 Tax=Mytilus coruscus TaxID=42192 RepID=A0A6J8DCM3_MYTCO|nr:unnamed protein product [Mytilus coruscus]
MFDDSNLISNLNQTNIEHDISEVKNSRERKLEKDIIQKLVNPEDKFGLPPVKKQNKFSNMSPSDLDETSAEIGDWHILKNVLPIFVKIYFDAGLKQLATKHHHGATLKVLTECSKFAITHRFFIQDWEAVMRHQMSLDEGEDDVCKTDVWEKVPKAPLSSKTTVIIDGIFIINTSPLASHQTFGDYCDFLFNGWIIKYYNQYTANEVHLLFNDPNRNGVSPKNIQRTRRNTVVQELVVPGGFDDDRKDRAISILNGQVVDYDLASANHEEADTRVWLHASVTTADQVIIYSPDTDKVEKTVEWYTKGCGCNSGCKTNRCKFKKAQNDNCDGFCGPGCKCVNCFNVPGSGDQVLDMSIDLDDVISDETEDFEDPVEDEQPEVDGLVEELDQKDDYWLFSSEEI